MMNRGMGVLKKFFLVHSTPTPLYPKNMYQFHDKITCIFVFEKSCKGVKWMLYFQSHFKTCLCSCCQLATSGWFLYGTEQTFTSYLSFNRVKMDNFNMSKDEANWAEFGQILQQVTEPEVHNRNPQQCSFLSVCCKLLLQQVT